MAPLTGLFCINPSFATVPEFLGPGWFGLAGFPPATRSWLFGNCFGRFEFATLA
jgi:hypothetical protein